MGKQNIQAEKVYSSYRRSAGLSFPTRVSLFLKKDTCQKKKTCHIFPFTLPRKSCQGKLAILNEA